MKYFLKLLQLVMIFLLASCFKNNKIEDNVKVKKSNVESKINEKKENVYIHKQKENNENENSDTDEFISHSLFEKWQGVYEFEQDSQLDSWGRESVLIAELTLIKPDSCVFKSWIADENGKRYIKNDNYKEIIGGILATTNKDSIEFYSKRVISGENNTLSPLLTLTKNGKNYFIYSFITSPPSNGIVEMPIDKR
ncbi:hypothetical protein [Flavobacterium johnsoniae]|uniref:hypothetical protein n=1 Tax=Flavobacterium johnsoniae TaxID=986 RepID=UPI0011EF1978|nr:hypothetical protein [Flavobacterium johnsoniae]